MTTFDPARSRARVAQLQNYRPGLGYLSDSPAVRQLQLTEGIAFVDPPTRPGKGPWDMVPGSVVEPTPVAALVALIYGRRPPQAAALYRNQDGERRWVTL